MAVRSGGSKKLNPTSKDRDLGGFNLRTGTDVAEFCLHCCMLCLIRAIWDTNKSGIRNLEETFEENMIATATDLRREKCAGEAHCIGWRIAHIICE